MLCLLWFSNHVFVAGKATSVPEWLKFLGMSQYESDFMNNGFDNLGFLVSIYWYSSFDDMKTKKTLNHRALSFLLRMLNKTPFREACTVRLNDRAL